MMHGPMNVKCLSVLQEVTQILASEENLVLML